MSRRCELTGKAVQTGNNVSHAHNKTRRRFMPNLQTVSMMSDTLGRPVKLRIAASTVRSVEHKGGIDAFLLAAKDADLPANLRRLKKRVKAAQAAT
ncbi:MAG: 50S ribosomal protein L28 [Rhodospirillaceae bacterium]